MYTETFYTDPSKLQKKISRLHERRREGKIDKPDRPPRASLTKNQRKLVHSKTGGRCHFCGMTVHIDEFQADHVICHVRGGSHREDNYLPSCLICNNYRWHYLGRELQIILKMGVWARTQVENKTNIGMDIAKKFSTKERSRIKRNG